MSAEPRGARTLLAVPWATLERGFLLLHVAFVAISVAAFWFVIGRPPPSGPAGAIWNRAYDLGLSWTGVLYIAAGTGAALCAWLRALPPRRAAVSAGAVMALGLAVELLGTHTGVPFGPYSYTTLLGPRLFGLVPAVIPLSWFLMLYASLGVALRVGAGRRVTIGLTAAGLVAWDVLMDPAMSAVFPFWRWHVDGAFYGMPLVNWAGWAVTGVVLAAVALRTAGPDVRRLAERRLPVLLYVVNGLLPLGLLLREGMVGAAVLGSLAMLGFVALPVAAARASRPASALHPRG